MSQPSAPGEHLPHGEARTELVNDLIKVDRMGMKNAFTPKVSGELAVALIQLDENSGLSVGSRRASRRPAPFTAR